MTSNTNQPATATYVKDQTIGVACSSCGSNSGYPITYNWWDEHTSPWHTLKYWIKRRLPR